MFASAENEDMFDATRKKPESQQLLGIKPKPPWLEPPVLYCCTVTTMIFDMYHTGGGSEGFSCTPG